MFIVNRILCFYFFVDRKWIFLLKSKSYILHGGCLYLRTLESRATRGSTGPSDRENTLELKSGLHRKGAEEGQRLPPNFFGVTQSG